MLNESVSDKPPSETTISASKNPALGMLAKSNIISPEPSPVKENVDGILPPFTLALNVNWSSVLSISENVIENLGFKSKIKLFLSKPSWASKVIVGWSFTGLIVIVTVLFLVMLFSTAVTENENWSWPLKFSFGL